VEGGIGFAHLGLMASTAEAIDRSPTASALFDETRLLAKAHKLTVQCFRTECAHLRHAADRAAFLAEQVLDREWRSLRVRALSDGGVELTGYLDAEGGAVVRTALEPLAARAGGDDERSREQRCADALVELVRRRGPRRITSCTGRLTVPPARDGDAWHWSPALPDEPALADEPVVAEGRVPCGVLRE
jgi:hypothetical protein